MKKLLKYFPAIVIALAFVSCETDNYDGPDAQMEGKIVINGTGDPKFDGQNLQTLQGNGNMKIRMIETSWTESESVTPRDINVMQDGTYRNTKLFAGTYLVYPFDGPFYPYTEDEYKEINLKGNYKLDFEVTPYLNVEWVEEPTVIQQPVPDSDPVIMGYYITAKAKFKINKKVIDGQEITPEVEYGRLMVATNHFAGNNPVGDYSVDLAYSNVDENQVITFTTRRHMLYEHTTMYVRIGFKCKVQAPNITNKYNYTSIIPVEIP